jgi:hypothetical protein
MTEDNDTRGLSQRELLLEVRADVKELHFGMGTKVGRMEMWSALGLIVTILLTTVCIRKESYAE